MYEFKRLFHQRFSSPGATTTFTTDAIPVSTWKTKSVYVVSNGVGGDDDLSIDIEYSMSHIGGPKYQPDGLVVAPDDFLPVSTAAGGTLSVNQVFPYSTEDATPWIRVSVTTGANPPDSIDVWAFGARHD